MRNLMVGLGMSALALGAIIVAAAAVPTGVALAANLGPNVCKDCHRAEHAVWAKTKHFKSFKTIHKSKKGKAILKVIGGKSIKKSEVCTQCHYTIAPKRAGKKAKANFGPSCESCHGGASDWFDIHNVYGDKGVKRDAETPDHKKTRLEGAQAKGMIWPHARYDVAANCFNCHGMARDSLDGEIAAKLMEAGHPLNPDFETVLYSQGSVRHRYYPPDMAKNAEMSAAELARWFVTGAAASIAQAEKAMQKTDNARYVNAQKARSAKARAAIEAVKGKVPAAAAFLGDPSEANARALVAAIAEMDLSGEVGGMLPDKGSYK